jgi:hypothetical protein
MVILYTYGYVDTEIVNSAYQEYLQLQEILGSRAFFVDSISGDVLNELAAKAKKSCEEKCSVKVRTTTLHQVVVLPSDNDIPVNNIE